VHVAEVVAAGVGVEGAVAVGEHEVHRARRAEELRGGGASGSGAADDDAGVFEVLVDDSERVVERGEYGDGGGVLIGVDDRDVDAVA
jgi:hypothetical protein